MTLSEVLTVLWHRRLLIGIATFVALMFGLIITVTVSARYQSAGSVLFTQPVTLAAGSEALATQEKLNLIVATYAQVVTSSNFLDRALFDANLPRTPAVSVSATNPIYASVVDITVTAPTPARAVAVTAALDSELISATTAAQTGEPGGDRISVQPLQTPVAHRASLSSVYLLAITLVIGLVLSITVALLLERP
jgi:capsular polysaccharide biosynthesis protein